MVVFSIDTCFTCNDNSYVNHMSSNVCEVGEKLLLKDVLNLLIDTGIPFENQGFVKTVNPETSVAFSKWLVTRTGVSAIAYMILGNGQIIIIFIIGGLC